jgi:hypothetical protein
MKGKSTAGITSPGPGSEITSQELTSGMNFPILQLQELHRSHVFPDVDHPSKALSNVFPEKRQGGIFAGLHMPACRFSSPLPAAASTGVSRDNGRVNRERPDITDLGNDDRRLSRRFYSPILLFKAYATDLPLCARSRDSGPPPSAMRPRARSRWRGNARTGTDGGAWRPRLHAPIRAFVAFDLRRSRCLFAVTVLVAAGFWLGVLGAEASVMRWLAASA